VFYADSLAFLGPQGKAPILDPEIKLDLAHLTAAPPWLTATDEILNAVLGFRETLERQGIRIIASGEDVDGNGLGVVLGLQSPPHDASPENLMRLREAGIRVMSIAYQDENPYGSGFLHPNIGLSDKGEDFLYLCDEAGFILDFSHAGHETAEEALRCFEGPVCASHTGVWEIYQTPRNLPTSLLQWIVENGGYVGIYTLTFGLSDADDSLAPFQRHLMAAGTACGWEVVGLGTDGVYQDQNLDELKKHFAFMREKIDPDGKIGARFPDQPSDLNTPRRMNVLEQRLRAAHLSENKIVSVMGGNFREFLKRALPSR
jgi:membrane dipeptidase